MKYIWWLITLRIGKTDEMACTLLFLLCRLVLCFSGPPSKFTTLLFHSEPGISRYLFKTHWSRILTGSAEARDPKSNKLVTMTHCGKWLPRVHWIYWEEKQCVKPVQTTKRAVHHSPRGRSPVSHSTKNIPGTFRPQDSGQKEWSSSVQPKACSDSSFQASRLTFFQDD